MFQKCMHNIVVQGTERIDFFHLKINDIIHSTLTLTGRTV